MAIIFELWVECVDPTSRDAVAQHFRGFEHSLSTGRTIAWHVNDSAGLAAGSCSLSVWSPDLGRDGVRRLSDALEFTESGLRLYDRLRSGPDFVFARVALEAGCVPLQDVGDYLEPHSGGVRLAIDCAMNEQQFQSLGAPAFCYLFRQGYRWTRYSGEAYSPLKSVDQPFLENLRKTLFPEDFTR